MKGPYTHQPSGLQTAWQSAPAFLLGRDGLNNDGVKFFKAFQSLLRDEDESNEEGDDRPSQSLKKKKGRLSDEANEGAQLDHPGPSLCAGALYQHLIGSAVAYHPVDPVLQMSVPLRRPVTTAVLFF